MKRGREIIGSIYFLLITFGVGFYCYAEEVVSSKGNDGSALAGCLILAWFIILAPIITHKIVYPIHRKHFLSSAEKMEEEVLLSDFGRIKKKIGIWIGDYITVAFLGSLIIYFILHLLHLC